MTTGPLILFALESDLLELEQDLGEVAAGVPSIVISDTNVTGSIVGNTLTLGWAGTLASGRLNANVVQAITNDANITGSITAQNLTLAWAGSLAVNRGGTGGTVASGTLLDNITAFSSTGLISRTGAGTYAFRTITGTGSRLTVTNGDGTTGNPTLDISASYVGQGSITTLGTITTGVWNGTAIANANLASVANNTIKSNISGGSAAPSDNTLSALLDALIGSGRGTIAVRGASTWGALALGSNTFLLQSNGTDLVYATPAAGATIASEAQAEAGTDNTVVMTPLRAVQGDMANSLGFKNVAGRNGGLEVWQSGTTIAIGAANNGYTCDGWYCATAASAASTVSRQSGLTTGSSFSARVQRNAGQTGGAVIFGFPLDTDELKKLAGQTCILQFTVSTGANWSPASGTLTYVLFTGTAAPIKQIIGYTGQATPLSSSTNLATSAPATTVYSAVFTVGSNIAQAELQFGFTGVGTAGANDWFQIDDVDLRVVPASLPAAKPTFERSDFVWDFKRCLRHFEKSYSYVDSPGSSTQLNANWSRNVTTGGFLWSVRTEEKRALPTVTPYGTTGTSGNVFNNATSTNIPATVDEIGTTSFRVIQTSGTTTAGDGMAFHWTSDARI